MTSTGSPRPRIEWRDVDGILLLDKDVGLTSNTALQRVRRLFRARKAGHTGSLDPLASGLLALCFGQGTKVSGMLLDADKTYLVSVQLGIRTTTGDAEGEVAETRDVPPLEREQFDAVLSRFVGSISQVPPMYSALKQGGRRLYELARKGIEVPREARTVKIHALHCTAWDSRRLSLEVRCSKGTYIRTLAEDIAQACGTVGHVISLRRTQLGPFGDEKLWTIPGLEDLLEQGGEEALDSVLLGTDAAVREWPAVELGVAEQAYVLQGQAVFAAGPPGAQVRMYGPERLFLGVGQMSGEGRRLQPVRIMLASGG